MNDTILEAQNLTYDYPDGTRALSSINIEIRRGQTTAVLGGNGAGKTTLFLNLNGILKPSNGQIKLYGRPVCYSRKGLEELRTKVGIVFQDPDSQLFSASVIQDISFGALNMGLTPDETKKRVEEAMIRTGVYDLKDKPTHCLSFGQKKRVAIAGILVMKPDVLILDEPTAGLDPVGVSEIMKLLAEAKEQLGLSVILATHDIDIVPLYSDYIYVMDHGELVIEGPPKDIFSSADILRKVNLRLPRIGHLMEVLEKYDGFEFKESAMTLSQARKEINRWKDNLNKTEI